MPKIISAGVIIFRRTKDGVKFLLLYHGRNYWNFPKGKIESEERSKEAAIREAQEETGLGPRDMRFIGNFKTYEKFFYRRGKETIFKVVILYLAETKKSRVSVSYEHEGYGWFTLNEAKKALSKYQESFDILRRASNYIRNPKSRRPNAIVTPPRS